MLISLLRRIFLFLSTVSLTATALVLVQTVHVGGTPTWQMGLALGAALAVLVPCWIAIVKTDDYLIPLHARWFYRITALLAALVGGGLLTFFTISDYPQSYFLYFGAAPAGLAALYVGLTALWTRESYGFPAHYREEKTPVLFGLLPTLFSVPLLAVSCGLLAFIVNEAKFEADKTIAEQQRHNSELPPDDLEDRTRRANEFFKLAEARQERQHYRQALDLFEKAATLGHTAAHYELALIYRAEGYLQDFTRTLEHLEKAHAQGFLQASYELGKIYRHGELGVETDFEKARSYLTSAAEGGIAEAQLELGHLYHKGEGVEKDPNAAFQWFLKAAEQGNATAQNDVGIFYLNGTSVEADPEEAMKWIAKAADQGVTVAQYNFGQALYAGKIVPQDYARAFTYFSKLAEKQIPFGFQMIGKQYLLGQGVDQNPRAAFDAFQQGARYQDEESLFYLGKCYLDGIGTQTNSTLALQHLRTAAKLGHGEAQFLLGQILLAGDIILQDRAEAAQFFQAAAANGVAAATEALADLAPKLTPEERAQAEIELGTEDSQMIN